MTTYNHSTSYNRTYEKKVIEETPRIRISSLPQASPFASHILPTSFSSFNTSLGGHIVSVNASDDSLAVSMDVSHFNADDLKLSLYLSLQSAILKTTEIETYVSVIGQFIVVEGKHPEKPDEFGTIERHFIRKFNLPRNVQPEGVSSNLSGDGILSIKAEPLKPKDGSPARAIPIKIVGGGTTPAPPAQEMKTEETK
ncbi:unnamed protein product [Heligmosomoides polygyrus]|uniref:SHSP domain-containing protein n=1 Tax=Heligmosomoides polygyrus TaxID=6339 RepID=A0A183G1Q5_HELPZ|nr:unnamed protein product [Heligmosomoides polygyrus]